MAEPVAPSRGVLRPLTDVRLDGGFWGGRQELNRSKLIPHCYAWESRLGWIDNFRDPHGERGREFADSDVYKMVEAMAWDGSFDAQIEDIAVRRWPTPRRTTGTSTRASATAAASTGTPTSSGATSSTATAT